MMLVPGAVAGIFTSDTALIQYTTWAMRIYMAGIFAMGFQIACQQSFMAGTGQGQPAAGLSAQDHFADPAHLHSAAPAAEPGVRRHHHHHFWRSRSATF